MVNYCNAMSIIRWFDLSELSDQNDIRDLVKEATAWADTKLKNHTTIPLTSVPDRLRHICEERVKLKFQIGKAPPSEAEALKARLEIVTEDLDEFVEETYKTYGGIAFFVGESET